jgi:hypothetical protein
MQSGIKYVAWSLTAAAVAIYLVMAGVTLPHLASLVGGEPMFDLRLLGYDFGTTQEILTRLGVDGAAYYENVQHRLDSAFPVLACLSLLYWLIASGRRWQGYGLPLGSAVLAAILATAVIGNAADLAENAAVSAMLAAGPKVVTPAMVHTASTFTLAKGFFSTIAYAALIVLVVGPSVAGVLKRKRP